MKKLPIRIIISVIIISLLATPVFVYGYTEEGEGRAALLQEGAYDIPQAPEQKRSSLLKGVTQTLEDYVCSQLSAMSSTINIASYNVPRSDIGAVYGNIINSHPELFFVSGSFGYNYYPSTDCVSKITPSYIMTAAEKEAATAEFNAGAERALAEVDDSMDDVQKALTLHDYLAGYGIYPNLWNSNGSYVSSLDLPIYHSAYGFFKDYTVVCQGFSLAYIYLLNRLGIECTYVSSDSMNHAWNMVKIGGQWYNVDVTWDNFDNVYDENVYGSVHHVHFLKSDDCFTDSLEHYGGTTYGNLSATSTAYDGAFWDELPCSRIYVVNGDYYYLAPYNGRYGILYLTKRTADGTETRLGNYFTTAYLNYSDFTDSLARLAYLDNRFYVVAGSNIYSKLLDGTQFTITSTDGSYCNGLGVNEDDNLVWQPYTDASQINELDKLDYFHTYLMTNKNAGYNNYPDINLDLVVNAKDYVGITK